MKLGEASRGMSPSTDTAQSNPAARALERYRSRTRSFSPQSDTQTTAKAETQTTAKAETQPTAKAETQSTAKAVTQTTAKATETTAESDLMSDFPDLQ